MAVGFDALVDVVLSEIALCGVQGAGSADFFRFVQKFYDDRPDQDASAPPETAASSGIPAGGLGRKFYEQVWKWVCDHADTRIVYLDQVRHYTLSEFEAAELHETGTSGSALLPCPNQTNQARDNEATQPSKTLVSIGGALRQQLLEEKKDLHADSTSISLPSAPVLRRQRPRNAAHGSRDVEPVFDDPESATTAPRLYASQSRIWQALTGHDIDLKKVPSMEFVLLSLIAAQGSDGIPQPDLIRVSGQDKRSVPHRTDELARKGYIVKIPVQSGKVRTSLCLHTKFSSLTHFLGSSAQEDVYKEDTFVLSRFAYLIYNTFKDSGLVPTRELRTRMGVPMRTWNKRATQGALVRLDQTGMIKRSSVRKNKTEDNWLTCIRVLRKPQEEDIMNMGFKRQAATNGDSIDDLLDDDADGDTLIKDLEADNLEEEEAYTDSRVGKRININSSDRIPPQWTPEQFLVNLAFDTVALGGSYGWDSIQLRDRMVGPFWRRPLESYLTRLTDDWERSQPMHLRHLAIIRDCRNTAEKKFIHYVYRTHGNFQKAVDAGVVHWAGVSQTTTMGPLKETPIQGKNSPETTSVLDRWGFRIISTREFVQGNGSATLSEARNSIVHRRSFGPRWDSAISQEIGHQKINGITRSMLNYSTGSQKKEKTATQKLKLLKPKKLTPILSLTPEQRVSLGLKPNGRLSKHAEKQIREHRRKTGDPCSLPEKIIDEPSRGGQPPLLTAEERKAMGLPPRGRLGIRKENELRAERGLAKLPLKNKKRAQKEKPEPTVLTKQQRIDLRWIDHGRLPQDLIEGLRKERKEGIALENSKVIAMYDEVMKAAKVAKDRKEAAKAGIPYVPDTVESGERVEQTASTNGDPAASVNPLEKETQKSPQDLGEDVTLSTPAEDSTNKSTSEAEERPIPTLATDKVTRSTSAAVSGKRKASFSTTSQANKRQQTESSELRSTSLNRSTAGFSVPADSAILQHAMEKQQASDETMLDTSRDTGHLCERESMRPSTRASELIVDGSVIKDLDIARLSTSIPEIAPIDVQSKPQLSTDIIIQEHVEAPPLVSLTRPTDMPACHTTHKSMDTTSVISETISSPVPVVESYTESRRSLDILGLMPPDVAKLTKREKSKYTKYTERSSPGVFLNPFARHKGLRGRPRKALIATFKFSNVSKLQWFRPDNSLVHRKNCGATVKRRDYCTPQANMEKHLDIMDTDGSKECANTTPHSSKMPATNQPLSDQSNAESSIPESSCEQEAQLALRITSPSQQLSRLENDLSCNSDVRKEVALPRGDKNPENIDANHESKEQSRPVAISTVESSNNLHGTRTSSPFRMVSGWTVINKPRLPDPPRYESPYSSTLNVDTGPGIHNIGDSNSGDPTLTATVPPVSAAVPSWHTSNAAMRRPTKPPKPRPKIHTKRTKKQQTLGSALFFRRKIIWDIIALCNGVFPDQGEIGRPFSKLWDQRHGHVQGLEKPIASTVNETMRNMCTNPAFGIKRMVFQVRMNYKKGPYSTKKAIIAYSHLDANSPEVLKLAHNITNFSHERSQQYFPEEIRHLIDDAILTYPVPKAPKDESIVLNSSPGQLEDHIKEAKRRRYRIRAEQKRLTAEARRAQNALVEQVPTQKGSKAISTAPGRRARLASLNDKAKKSKSGPLTKAIDIANAGSEELDQGEADIASNIVPLPALNWKKPVITPIPTSNAVDPDMGSTSGDDESEEEELPEIPAIEVQKGGLADPGLLENSENMSEKQAAREQNTPVPVVSHTGNKRVRIADPTSQLSRKKPCHSIADKEHIQGPRQIDGASGESDESLSAEVDDKTDRNVRGRSRVKTKKQDNKTDRRFATNDQTPTLLDRLTGLTGNPNDPIYLPPDRERIRVRRPRSWNERKNHERSMHSSKRGSTESVEDIDHFKYLFFSLVIATSMSGVSGVVDWGIFEKLDMSSIKWWDQDKTKKLWTWMQTNMAEQVAELTADFQTKFLEAYEQDQVSPIEDPSTYDWAALVRWAIRKCTYHEVPLPTLREALHHFVVDESNYEILDRVRWHRDKVADRSRTLLQLQHSFVSPLHRARKSTDSSSEDKFLKARSWVRANTATPQALYDGHQAHEKLMKLEEPALIGVVSDFVKKQSLRMRKLKRLLPGRNYDFTKVLARKYVRPFELSDFMAAVRVKKDMDAAFSGDDPSKRFYSLSRLEEDGSIAAIMTMVSEGVVKLVPQLPAVNNEFGAPLPRLSIWGFCEGDYIHRAIDRERLFWDIYVVPTTNYSFGNPLMPSPQPLASAKPDSIVVWPDLPAPPLPGKHNPDALLPIWSNIDGQSVTWPWWYRILNLVLQPLIFQPGATCFDIYSHCATHTAEMFEIELVVDWLESVNAVRKTVGGGYITGPGFWAAFGDSLREAKDDWLGEHIKRKRKHQDKQQWREQYNLRHSTLQIQRIQQSVALGTAEQGLLEAKNGDQQPDTAQKILQNPKKQYEISQQALKMSRGKDAAEDTNPSSNPSPVATLDEMEQVSIAEPPAALVAQTLQGTDAPSEDVSMVDADAEGERTNGGDFDA